MVKTTSVSEPLFNYEGRLSEGPTYNPSNNTLYWVDIIAGKIHSVILPTTDADEYTPEELAELRASHKVYTIENEAIGVIYLTKNDDLLYVGARSGIASFKLSTSEFNYVWKYPKGDENLRSNDGNVDPSGENIWCGLMGDFPVGPVPNGKLYKLNIRNGEFEIKVPNVLIPNGINWSKDSKVLYWTSSLDLTIYKFDYDSNTGEISNQQPFVKLAEVYPESNSPEPDGHSITEESHLFTAVWGTNTVAHFNPKGELVEFFKFPAERISCVAFGGKNLDEMFITSANLNLDDVSKLNENPQDLGGSVFRVKARGHRGILRTKLNIE